MPSRMLQGPPTLWILKMRRCGRCRLEECVELLESMNACNHLNMDKVWVGMEISFVKNLNVTKGFA